MVLQLQSACSVLQWQSAYDMQVVKPGTNGGVSALGTAAGLAGGVLIGCCYCVFETWVAGVPHVTALGCRAVAIGAAAGMLGNLVDSVLGATLQYVTHLAYTLTQTLTEWQAIR